MSRGRHTGTLAQSRCLFLHALAMRLDQVTRPAQQKNVDPKFECANTKKGDEIGGFAVRMRVGLLTNETKTKTYPRKPTIKQAYPYQPSIVTEAKKIL